MNLRKLCGVIIASLSVASWVHAAMVVVENKSTGKLEVIISACADKGCSSEQPLWQGVVEPNTKKYAQSDKETLRLRVKGTTVVAYEFSGDARTFVYTGGCQLQVTGGAYRKI